MADDSSMKTPATTEDIARVTSTASERLRQIGILISELRCIEPRDFPIAAKMTMDEAADELEQLIGGPKE